MALSFHRPQHRFLSNYLLLHHHHFSSSNDHSTPPHDDAQTPPNPQQTPTAYLQSLKKNLAQYRKPQSQPSDSSTPISFEDYYQRNANSKRLSGTSPPSLTKPASASFAFDQIKESLKNMERKNPRERNVLRGGIGNVGERSNVIGGTQGFPAAISGKEMTKDDKESVLTAFQQHYSHKELGEKLRSLRPVEKSGEKGWFSLQELNERLKKLKKLELDNQSTVTGVNTLPLRDFLGILKVQDEEKARKTATQNLNLFGKLTSSMRDIQKPPKEHLLEKYFHPDNMSAEEKMKIELAKVRDEFKISESDCGSARVQVAQLTTKIKHLSAVLHKKDKHSRKGLQEMVQRRKKLLKYLRRTDWESYCFVISKLGLRDNPDFKESHKKRLSS